MGQFTVYDDSRVDGIVAGHLELIVSEVTSAHPVRAVILGGGFGRGEGSVLVDRQGVRPLNDYDLFLVVPDDFAVDLRPLAKELARKINIRLIDLIPLKQSALATLPVTQINYDLKYGGRLLWGEDALALMPAYEQGKVAPESIRTLLLNRLVCAIESYSETSVQRGLTGEESFFLVNQTGKIVSAGVEALLMHRRTYHHRYQERHRIFAREFPDRIELQRLNKRATEFKLRPSESFTFNPVAYWHDAVREYLAVMAELLIPSPGSAGPREALWRSLSADGNTPALTGKPVERIELMLLLYREAEGDMQQDILSRTRAELGQLTGTPLPDADWEQLRERTTRLWHEICH